MTETLPAAAPPRVRRWLLIEVLLVLGVSLGRSAIFSVWSLVGSLTAHVSLSHQAANLHGSAAPGRPLLDLAYQLLTIAFTLVPVGLVWYLLTAGGERASAVLGVDASQPLRDLARGAALAAGVGGVGLALYLGAYRAGLELKVVADGLPSVWWHFPVLVLSALENALLEEVVVLGFVTHRLSQMGLRPWPAAIVSALVRGSYHLYQGFGGFVGNAVMGLLFARLYQRWGRVLPMVIAHTLIDSVAFIGYDLLHGHVSWLP